MSYKLVDLKIGDNIQTKKLLSFKLIYPSVI